MRTGTPCLKCGHVPEPRPQSAEHRARISQALEGRKLTEEHKARIAESTRRRKEASHEQS